MDEEDDAGAEQANEVGFFILSYTRVLIFLAANPGEPGEGCLSFCHFPGTGGEKKRSTLNSKLSQDSPLLGERMAVEMELQSGASLHQVDIHTPIVLSTFNQAFVYVHFQVNQEGQVTEETKESDSGEDETKVGQSLK